MGNKYSANKARLAFYNLWFLILHYIPVQVTAQQPDFTGKWVLVDRISLSGIDYANGIPSELGVIQTGKTISLERVNLNQKGDYDTVKETLNPGKSTETIASTGKRRSSVIKWSDDLLSFTEHITYFIPDSNSISESINEEAWLLSDSGRLLTITKKHTSLKNAADTFSMKGIYERRNGSNGTSLVFESGYSWNRIVEKARKEGKGIFVDCYTTWCGPCKKMDATTFSSGRVGEYLSKNFISVKLQMDTTANDNDKVKKGYGVAEKFKNLYKVNAFPCFLFFSPGGELLTKKIGFLSTDPFLKLARAVTDNPSGQPYYQLRKYLAGNKEYKELPGLAQLMMGLSEKDIAYKIADDYIDNYLFSGNRDNLNKKENIQFMVLWTRFTNSSGFRFLDQQGAKADELTGQTGYARKSAINIIYGQEIVPEIKNKMTDTVDLNWGQLYEQIKTRFNDSYAKDVIITGKLSWYSFQYTRHKKWFPGYLDACVERMKTFNFNSNSTNVFEFLSVGNDIEYAILRHCNDKVILKQAIYWMENCIRRSPIVGWLYPYAGLLYKAGLVEEGIRWQEIVLSLTEFEAIKLGVEKGKFYEQQKTILEKMKKGEKDIYTDDFFFKEIE